MDLISAAGFDCVREPYGLFATAPGEDTEVNMKRPDIQILDPGYNVFHPLIYNGQDDIILDISVTNPLADYHSTSPDCIKSVEKNKMDTYDALSKQHNLCFSPVIFETLGAWSEFAKSFVAAMVKRIHLKSNNGFHTEEATLDFWRRRIATVLQRSQSDVFINRIGVLTKKMNGVERGNHKENLAASVQYRRNT
jgi:hypothetical protein